MRSGKENECAVSLHTNSPIMRNDTRATKLVEDIVVANGLVRGGRRRATGMVDVDRPTIILSLLSLLIGWSRHGVCNYGTRNVESL
eukprot:scaffold361036_cov28-Attheya_sp.AAC.1